PELEKRARELIARRPLDSWTTAQMRLPASPEARLLLRRVEERGRRAGQASIGQSAAGAVDMWTRHSEPVPEPRRTRGRVHISTASREPQAPLHRLSITYSGSSSLFRQS